MVSNHRWIASLAAIAVLGGLLGCAGSANSDSERLTNADLVFVTFGSVNGEIAPCG